jgi:glycerol-3-phosphate dehydrogenase (NAD(P)+)
MRIGVIGAGGWGTALANILAHNHNEVLLWSHEEDVINDIRLNRHNSRYLPGIDTEKSLIPTTNFEEVSKSEIFVLAIPTQFIRQVLTTNRFDPENKIIINVAKGIEEGTTLRVSEILMDVVNLRTDNYSILTGPSHAEEVSRKMPTTVVTASMEMNTALLTQKLFNTKFFRVYSSSDVIGCEIGGALKNVIAIAAGIIDGLELGDNTKAALITRGIAEISRLGTELGADNRTFSGLSGLGDLFVTCNSRHSRNRFVGEQIGRGRKLNDIMHEMQMVAEGIKTTKSAWELAAKHKVELPIIEQVHKILIENVPPLKAINELMTRQSREEWW